MILGQLIQTGRHFCECRSRDFIPQSEDHLVLICYSIHDQLKAYSLDRSDLALFENLQDRLTSFEAIAYILIERVAPSDQREFPVSWGRAPMDRITLTAATPRRSRSESYYLQNVRSANAFRLIPTTRTDRNSQAHQQNFLRVPSNQTCELTGSLFPENAAFAS